MTYFAENLAALRKRAGYTQETLAEALGVSRQAVGKWESSQGLPEASTLLTLADLLGCSLDQLMRQPLEEVEEGEAPSADNASAGDPTQDWAVFAGHMSRFAFQVALGVALVLVGVALTVAAAAYFPDSGFIALPVLVMVACAVFNFVFAGLDHGNFQKAYPVQPPCPYPDEMADFDAKFRGGLAAAVAGVLVSVALLVAAAVLFEHNEFLLTLAVAGFMALLAVCVATIVWLGIRHSMYHPEPEQPHGRDISGAIMLTATAIYLFLGFTQNLWHPGWVVFPIGGIACGIVESLQKKN